MNEELYYFWKAPTNGPPEYTSGGHGVSVIPGLGQFVMLHKTAREIPRDAIPASEVLKFLSARRMDVLDGKRR